MLQSQIDTIRLNMENNNSDMIDRLAENISEVRESLINRMEVLKTELNTRITTVRTELATTTNSIIKAADKSAKDVAAITGAELNEDGTITIPITLKNISDTLTAIAGSEPDENGNFEIVISIPDLNTKVETLEDESATKDELNDAVGTLNNKIGTDQSTTADGYITRTATGIYATIRGAIGRPHVAATDTHGEQTATGIIKRLEDLES